jgi:hypothetical protein
MLSNNYPSDFSKELSKHSIQEYLNCNTESFLEFVNSTFVDFVLKNFKTGLNSNVKPRVMNNWIKVGAVIVAEEDKGKIKRFNISENIWLEIFEDLRAFGVSLEKLRYIREQLSFSVKKFDYLKYNIIKSIFGDESYLQIFEEGEIGFVNKKWLEKNIRRGGRKISINLDFSVYVKNGFENNCIDENFNDLLDYDDTRKLKLLFCLKTNFYKSLTIKLSDGDIRLINNTSELFSNTKLLKKIINMDFESIRVDINDEVHDII